MRFSDWSSAVCSSDFLRTRTGCWERFPSDPEAAAKAIAAGVGRRITLAVGGRFTPGFVPLEITGDVVSATDGRFIMKGPYQAGEVASLGATAVVRVGSLSVILTSLPGPTQDPRSEEHTSELQSLMRISYAVF